MRDLAELEKKLQYTFRDKELLRTALTHSSYANEHKGKAVCNERLEFLGDAVLGVVVADYLYLHFPDMPEGELTKKRAALVCEKALSGFSRQLGLGEYLRLSRGEQHSGGKDRSSILCDVFEAVIAAIYLDAGMERAREHILRFVLPQIKQAGIQQNPEEELRYVLTGESGPDHDKHFTVEVHLNSNVIGKGGGRSKKEAEQQAAREALELMGY